MKKILYISAIFLIYGFFVSCSVDRHDVTSQSLETGFINPPDSIQTSVYWYWVSDHLSEEGVIKDLQAMKEKGINRAFIGNIGQGDSGRGDVRFRSEEWWQILHTALKTATELGIDIGIFNCPGWSQSGGPWVKPEQSMRYLASTSTPVKGGDRIEVVLPKPEGRYSEYFQDVKVIAYPAVGDENSIINLDNATVTSSIKGAPVNNIFDGNRNTEIVFSKSDARRNIVFNFKTKKPFTLLGIKVFPVHQPIDAKAKIEVWKNGRYRTLKEFTISRFNPELNVGFDPYAPIVVSIPETKSDKFRLVISNAKAGAGLKEVLLSSVPFVESYPEKSLAKMYQTPLPLWHEYQWKTQPEVKDKSLIVQPSQIIDVTQFLKNDTLSWDAPAGDWIVMRTGMLPTGVVNAPSFPEDTGLETDKMSEKHIEAHFDAFLGEIMRRIPAVDRKSWKVVVEDSYETGGQNFTDGFLEEFQECYGYDPVPFLPVFSGVVVKSQDVSDRFLWDVRRMVADKVAYDYVGGLRKISNKHGLTTWLENYGHWGFLGEFLQYGGQSDEIGGEFWSEGSLGDIENRAASSCGHIYGKNKISAESFTAAGGGFHRYPAMMKQRGDRFFTEGINNTLLHVYISQAYEDREPGVNAWFGNEFNRKNTWYPHIDLFIDYLKRANFMLQQGTNIADVAYFIGEDAPKMTGITRPELPKGYQFDYINAEVIEKYLTVKNGMLTLPHGTQYRILVLPPLETMRPELLSKIEKLVEDGAVVMGPRPKRSPSLKNYPQADQEVKRIASRMWSKIDPSLKCVRIGKGMLIDGMNMQQALNLINCVPDCKIDQESPMLYGHRSVNGMEIYFVSNQSDEPIVVTPEFRVKGMQPELWDAIDGRIRKLPSFMHNENGTGTMVPLKLDAYESAFIVFREQVGNNLQVADVEVNFPKPEMIMRIDNPWEVLFDTVRRGPSEPLVMNELYDISKSRDFDIKHYSGTLRYNNAFNLAEIPENSRLYLDMNDLSAMAKVKINDKYVGGVWTPPYRVDITDYVQEGNNNVEIEVTTTWVNRLLGDLELPAEKRKTWVAINPWKGGEPLHKSGLIGPVTIQSVTFQQ